MKPSLMNWINKFMLNHKKIKRMLRQVRQSTVYSWWLGTQKN